MTKNQISWAQLQEDKRKNRASEQLTSEKQAEDRRKNLASERHNAVALGETQRHNQQVEAISLEELGIKQQDADTRSRSQTETARHNLVQDDLGRRQLAETTRANQAKEAETLRSNLAKEAETQRSNVAREEETQRHNVAQEEIVWSPQAEKLDAETRRTNVGTVTDILGTVDDFRRTNQSGLKMVVDVVPKLIDAIIPF